MSHEQNTRNRISTDAPFSERKPIEIISTIGTTIDVESGTTIHSKSQNIVAGILGTKLIVSPAVFRISHSPISESVTVAHPDGTRVTYTFVFEDKFLEFILV